MSIESAISFFLAIFIFGITPGPGVFAILARALVSGASSCFFLALGMTISDIIYLILACFGLAALAEHWGAAFMAVRIIGAIYLIYLGIKMWRAARQHQELPSGDVLREKKRYSFLQGFLISASNPKVILFYIAFLPTFMDLTILTSGDIVLASVLTLLALMAGLMLIAAGASSARRYVRSERGQKTLNRTAGSVMIGAGTYLVSSG
ncbi:Threonine/homoserine/homoserine lactone efflux protein [Malonomonas rubra DSM 5091]|uniref:Threonine/homoserine/homoserine lactone efflux protein n=1 Tax=Malonomonas rubra DSM 5091 TaxID=1122189 RepID=A0A1M6ML56_MALRU|nr:LysE family translocator [Malonomonas rubra]SHJ84197.1 Threonine/homoserine/homoserine lactone efflux protein [Malonomonas rubra DSM 5091]